ncbi:MAG: methylmalonyl-CoA epimerase [Actinobacteria bacterium]|nr:methylmalonyl-CoA epimerase [Actinomycetota bacterium]
MKIRQVAIGCKDLNRAQDFYTRLLGKPPIAVFDPPGLCFFDLGGTRLLIEIGGPASLIYLEVPDVKASISDLRERGFKITSEPHIVFPDPNGLFDHPGNEWLAFIEDSEGNAVGLMSRERA